MGAPAPKVEGPQEQITEKTTITKKTIHGGTTTTVVDVLETDQNGNALAMGIQLDSDDKRGKSGKEAGDDDDGSVGFSDYSDSSSGVDTVVLEQKKNNIEAGKTAVRGAPAVLMAAVGKQTSKESVKSESISKGSGGRRPPVARVASKGAGTTPSKGLKGLKASQGLTSMKGGQKKGPSPRPSSVGADGLASPGSGKQGLTSPKGMTPRKGKKGSGGGTTPTKGTGGSTMPAKGGVTPNKGLAPEGGPVPMGRVPSKGGGKSINPGKQEVFSKNSPSPMSKGVNIGTRKGLAPMKGLSSVRSMVSENGSAPAAPAKGGGMTPSKGGVKSSNPTTPAKGGK